MPNSAKAESGRLDLVAGGRVLSVLVTLAFWIEPKHHRLASHMASFALIVQFLT